MVEPTWEVGQTMSSAPKDRPILAWCDHEADPRYLPVGPGNPEGSYRLTLYAAHADGLSSHAPTGWAIIEWGGAYGDGDAWLPDWWFVAGREFEVAANPTRWWELPSCQEKEAGYAE